jgi:hypothetical protein
MYIVIYMVLTSKLNDTNSDHQLTHSSQRSWMTSSTKAIIVEDLSKTDCEATGHISVSAVVVIVG